MAASQPRLFVCQNPALKGSTPLKRIVREVLYERFPNSESFHTDSWKHNHIRTNLSTCSNLEYDTTGKIPKRQLRQVNTHIRLGR